MDEPIKYKLSYPDSQKMLNEVLKKYRAIDKLLYDCQYETKKQATAVVNKLVYETAEKIGISVYDLCFRTIPEYGTPEIDIKEYKDMTQNMTFTQTLKLIPVEFDLTHDGGYWKKKYFALKAKMQELIDEKED